VFVLKPLLREIFREHLGNEMFKKENMDQIAALDARIDEVAMMTFDKYMECRGKLHQVRTNEIRNRSAELIDKLGGAGSCVSNCKGEPVNDDA
jgi:hypothetical protein